jgi:pimeloyl-ACP methyl ester carboxylesterase
VFPQYIKDNAVDQRTKLTMPVLAVGTDHSLGAAEASQMRQYATNVTGMVIKNSGRWIYEEHPAEMTQILLNFLKEVGIATSPGRPARPGLRMSKT